MRKSFLIGLCLLLVMSACVSAEINISLKTLKASPNPVIQGSGWKCEYWVNNCSATASDNCEVANMSLSGWFNTTHGNAYLLGESEFITHNFTATTNLHVIQGMVETTYVPEGSDSYFCQFCYWWGGSQICNVSRTEVKIIGSGGELIDPVPSNLGGGGLVKSLRDYNPTGYDHLDAAWLEWVKGEDFEHFFVSGFDLLKALVSYVFKQPGSLVPMGGVS